MNKNLLKTHSGKRIVFLCLILAVALRTSAQNDFYTRPTNTQNNTQTNTQNTQQQPASTASTDSLPKFYLGVGTGINNYVGIIGPGAEFRVYHSFIIRAGFGIGTWGTKFSIAARYELEQFKGRGWVMGLGYSFCKGITNFQTQLAVDTGSAVNQGTETRQVTLNLNPASSLNLTASYNWAFHKQRNKFYLEFGYAVALQSAPYQVLDGSVLDNTSKATLNVLSPGGIVLDLGFMFAL